MAKTVRYCIQCGKEIGDEPFCTNPGCRDIPNFYLNVPGPGLHFSRLSDRGTIAGQQPGAEPYGSDRPTAPCNPPEDTPRQTLPLRAAPVAVLRSTDPPHGQHAVYPGVTIIGARSPAQILINRPEVSSRHARLVCAQDQGDLWSLTVEDAGSTNGTFVNGKPITTQRLEDRDLVRFACCEFEVRFVASEDPRVTLAM